MFIGSPHDPAARILCASRSEHERYDMMGLPNEAEALKRWLADASVALTLLTRIPSGGWMAMPSPSLAESMRTFPIIGALVGILAGLVLALASGLGAPPLLAAAIVLAFAALMTGALHEDGFADMVDGFGGGDDREETLAIMRDSRIGTYGVIALVLVLIAKSASLAAFATGSWYAAAALLAGTGAFSRALIVWLMGSLPPARPDGLSAAAGQPTANAAQTALLIGGIGGGLMLAIAGGIVMALISLAAGWAAAGVVRMIAQRRIGGQTGDVCGGVQVLSETAMLAVAAIMLP
jgi:adenosylcobinamide-GDP ribazoletransferase